MASGPAAGGEVFRHSGAKTYAAQASEACMNSIVGTPRQCPLLRPTSEDGPSQQVGYTNNTYQRTKSNPPCFGKQ